MKRNLNNKIYNIAHDVSENSGHSLNAIYFIDTGEYLAVKDKKLINPITYNECEIIHYYNFDGYSNFICVTKKVEFSASLTTFASCASIAAVTTAINRYTDIFQRINRNIHINLVNQDKWVYAGCFVYAVGIFINEAMTQENIIEIDDVRYNFEQLPTAFSVSETHQKFSQIMGVFSLENYDILIDN